MPQIAAVEVRKTHSEVSMLGAQIAKFFGRLRRAFQANFQPQPRSIAQDGLETDSRLGLTSNELDLWDAYARLLEARETWKITYFDVSQLPAPKDEIDRVLKKAILHLSVNGSGKEALNACVLSFVLLAYCQDIKSLDLTEEAFAGLSALQQVVRLSSLDDKEAAFSNIATEHVVGRAATIEMEERLRAMRQFFLENNLNFPE